MGIRQKREISFSCVCVGKELCIYSQLDENKFSDVCSKCEQNPDGKLKKPNETGMRQEAADRKRANNKKE